MATHTLRKAERLHSRKAIGELFGGKGRSLSAFPLRAVYLQRPSVGGEPRVQMLVSVPKRLLRHAVGRNRVKRQVREAFRLHKQPLAERLEGMGLTVSVAFIWLDGRLHDSSRVGRQVASLLMRIGERVATEGNGHG